MLHTDLMQCLDACSQLMSSNALQRAKQLTVTLRLPPPNRSSETLPLFTLALNLADAIASGKAVAPGDGVRTVGRDMVCSRPSC